MKQKIHQSFNTLKYSFFIVALCLITGKSWGQILWSSSGGSAWLTGSNWTGGVTPNSSQVAQIGNNPTGNGGIGINMNGSTNNGTNNQAVGAIEMTSARTSGNPIVGNSSTTSNGILTMNGAVVNSISNVILRNNSAQSITIQDIQGSGNKTMSLALNNATDNKIVLDGAGDITISSIIQGTNKPLTFTGISTAGAINISGANTFSGSSINFLGAETIFSADAGLGAVPGSTVANALIVDGGRFTMTGSFTLNSKRGIQVGNTSGTSISIKASSSVITYNGIIANKTSVAGDLTKQGAGILILGGLNTYSGSTNINNGMINLGITNSLPVTTTLTLGQVSSTNTGTLNMLGFSQQVAGLSTNINASGISSKNMVTSSTPANLTINAISNFTYGAGTSTASGIISGALSIIKNGAGLQAFGDANTYSGSTTINSGTLQISPTGTVNTVNTGSSNIILNGGVLSTSGINSSASITFSTITLSDNSFINISSSNIHTLAIATSSNIAWASTKTLTIVGWKGSYCGGSGTATKGKITIGANSLSLTSAQLSQILFFDGTYYYPAKLSSTGELIPNGSIPSIPIPASSNGPVCSGNTLSLSVTATGAPSPTFSWSGPNSFTANTQSPSISNVGSLAAGVYSATATNTCGTISSTVSVVINSVPSISIPASSNGPICSGNTLSLSVTATGVPLPSYSWSGPNSFTANIQSPSISNVGSLATGVYSATATNICGTVTSTVSVNVNSTPTISIPASNNGPVCSGNTLSLSVNATGFPSPSYFWSGPNSYTASVQSPSISNVSTLAAGIYSVTAMNVCGSVTSTVSVIINSVPILSPISSTSICPNKSVSVSFASSPVGSTFNWTNDNSSIGLMGSGSGNISFTTSLLTTNQTAIITVTPTLNGCLGTSQSFNIFVQGDPSSSIWTGAISSDWFLSDNWTNCVCGSSTNATITAISSPSFYPVLNGSSIAYVNNIQIDANATLSVQSTQTLNIKGDYINNGTFISSQGLVTLSGNSIQVIGGASNTDFYDLQLNNSSGVNLNSSVGIKSSLYPDAGTFATNGKLTLLASLLQTGRIAAINSSADVIGNVIVQQIAKGGHTGWALLGAPVTSSLTMVDWNDDFSITCVTCPNGAQAGFTSIYTYDETASGGFSAATKYIPITSIHNNIINGRGYWVYLGNGYPNTTNITFDVNGAIAKSSCLTCSSSISIPVSYTNNNLSVNDNGWNLIANPLPSPISWTELRNSNANVDDAIYVYNTDLLNGSGDYASYVNGVSSNLTGGIGDAIPMCQAFYIHSTGATTLYATENTKISSNQLLLKTNASSSIKPIVRLVMNGGSASLSDMTTFYFESGATNSFEKKYDAYKLIYDQSLPYIGSLSSNNLTGINGLPDLSSNITVPVKAITHTTHSYTFSILKSDFPSTVCVYLYDSYTGISTNLSNSTYNCTLYDTTQTSRFSLNFSTVPLSGTAISNQPSCSSPHNGFITATGNNSGPWDFEWKDVNNTIVKTSYNKFNADTLSLLSGGNYSVKINTTGQCDLFSSTFNINPIVIPVADFYTNIDTIYLSFNNQFMIANNSLNSTAFNWNFGDLTGIDNSVNPIHIYNTAGTYSITLTVESVNSCLDSIKKTIVVVNDITNIKESSEAINSFMIFNYQNTSNYLLKINLLESSNIIIKLFSINGQLITSDKLSNTNQTNYMFDLKDKPDGIYLLQAATDKGIVRNFKLKK